MSKTGEDYIKIEEKIENCIYHNFYYSLTVYDLCLNKIQALPKEKQEEYMERMRSKRKNLEGKTLLLHAIRF